MNAHPNTQTHTHAYLRTCYAHEVGTTASLSPSLSLEISASPSFSLSLLSLHNFRTLQKKRRNLISFGQQICSVHLSQHLCQAETHTHTQLQLPLVLYGIVWHCIVHSLRTHVAVMRNNMANIVLGMRSN